MPGLTNSEKGSSCLANALDLNNRPGNLDGEWAFSIPNMFRTFALLPVTRRTFDYSLLRARHFSSDLRFDGARLTIPGKANFLNRWLRDSCQCPSCVHPSTSQKLHKSSDIPADIRPIPGGLTTTAGGVHIRWIDGHESFYGTAFLERYSSPSELLRFHRDTEQILWNKSTISQAPDLYIPYNELIEPCRLLAAINQLTQYGLLFVTGVPNEQTSDDTCELPKLANIFGELRTTFYGNLWDVKNVRNSRNIAYTNLDLDLHMDLLYVYVPHLTAEDTQAFEQLLPTPTAIPDPTLLAQPCRGWHFDLRRRPSRSFVAAKVPSSGL